MTGDDQPDVRPEDALQVAQRALTKANDLEAALGEVTDQLETVRDDLAAVQFRLSEIDEERSYESLSIDEKIGKVREHAFRKAVDGHGRATLDYNAIKWEVFDGKPGADHCYKLMRLAAGEDEDDQRDLDAGMVGFAVCDPPSDNRHLAVDAERAKRGLAFSSENKTSLEGVGRE